MIRKFGKPDELDKQFKILLKIVFIVGGFFLVLYAACYMIMIIAGVKAINKIEKTGLKSVIEQVWEGTGKCVK